MRILKCNKIKWEIKSIIAYIIAVILAIICGIVLFKLNNFNNYIYQFADIYIFYVFNFKNGSLFFAHILSELLYLYIVFLLVYFSKLKFLCYPVLFLRTAFFTFYLAFLCAFFGTEGILVALIVFLPSCLFSIVIFVFLCEQCRQICSPLCYFSPLILALIKSVILMLLVNVVFRVIVVIV